MPRLCSGLSLIELLATLAVLSMLLAIATPSMTALQKRSALASTHNLLLSGLSLARNEAVNRQRSVFVCPGDPVSGCRGDGVWDDGWLIFVDPDNDGRTGSDRIVLHHENRVPEALRIRTSAARPRIVFRPDGSASGTNLTVRICTSSGAKAGIVVSNAGRPRSASTGEVQGMAGCT